MAKNSEATLLLRIKEIGAEALDKVRGGLDAVGKYAAIAGGAIVAFAIAAVKQYSDAEQASNQLTQAIKNQGLDVKILKKQYDELAGAIQNKSTYDDDEITKGIALAQAQAGRVVLTDKLIKATVDYAAATGTDLSSAFEKVGKTIGTSTNALAREGVQLGENLSSSQKMAEITDILNDKFEGQAEVMTRSAGGAIKQMNNALGNMAETIGEELSPFVVKAAQRVNEMVAAFRSFSKTDGFQGFLEVVSKSFAFIDSYLHSSSMRILKVIEYGKLLKASMTFNEDDKKKAEQNIEALNKELVIIQNNFKVKNENITKEYENKRRGIVVETEETIVKEQKKIRASADTERENKMKEELRKERLASQKSVEDFKDFEWQQTLAQEKRIASQKEKGAKKLADFMSIAMTSGVKGVTEKAFGDMVDSVFKDFGPAASQMFALLSQDTEKFIDTVNTLFSTKFLDNIAANIPILVERFAEAMPQIIDRFNEKIPEIVQAMTEALIANSPKMAAAMGTGFSDPAFTEALVLAIANGSKDGLRGAFQNSGEMLSNAFKKGMEDGASMAFWKIGDHIAWAFNVNVEKGFNQALDRLKDRLSSMLSISLPGTGGGGGVGGYAGQVIKAAGFAHGGTVKPLYAANGMMTPRGTDTVPAMLSPGEFVVNASSARSNRSALEAINGGGGSGGQTVINIYAQALMADQQQATQFAKSIDRELLKLRQTGQSVAFDKSTF